MNARYQLPLRVAAVSAACAVVGVVAAAPAGAAGNGDVKVVNTETVQVYTSPSGQVQTRRVYEQLALTGHGKVDLSNPISTDHLRNLDGFSGFTVKDGRQITTADVSGEKRLRSVSNYDGDLPLDVSVAYKLDGKNVEPGDVVGKSGHLEVTYTVRNVTAKPQPVTFDDGKGGTVTKTVPVPIPLVGSLTTTTPAGFTNVASDSANMGGDGKGGTQLSFTMTLFPPIGSDTAVFGYSADVTDAVIPRATVSALPVNPLASPTFKSAAGSYKGGADTGAELADGAGQIDQNLLKLRDGASQLLAGLIKLRDGAGQLETGLAGQAVPGAHKLADGAGQLDAGLGRLHSGARRLAAGAGEAYVGSHQLSAGAAKLDGGLGRLSKGAGALAAGADDAYAGSTKLNAGATKLSAGAGAAKLGGQQLADGASRLDAGMATLYGSMPTLSGGAGALAAGQAKLAEGLTLLYNGVAAMPASVKQQLNNNLDYQRLLGGLAGMVAGIGDPSDVTNPVTHEPATLFGGINAVAYGLTNPLASPAACAAKDDTKCGATDGLDYISSNLYLAINDPNPDAGTVEYLKDAILSLATQSWCTNDTTNTCITDVQGLAQQVADGQKKSLQDLKDGIDHISTAVKSNITGPAPTTAISSLRRGLSNLTPATCDPVSSDDQNPLDDCGLTQAVQMVQVAIPQLVDQLTNTISTQLLTSIGTPTAGCDPTATLRCAAAALAAGSSDLAAGVSQLSGGVTKLKDGSGQVATGAGDLSTGLGALSDGAGQLADGTGTLKTGLRKLDAGAGKLAAGAADAKAGSGKLAAGAGDLSTGLGRLHAGAGRLAAGATDAEDGSGKIAKGANDLATGLEDAANGSSRLKAGLSEAAAGAPKLVDGAQRLSDEGTKKLVAAGKTTAQSYGEMYATMTAGAERAKTESMAFGAPKGAVGLTAYNYVIQGDDGEGGRNWTRGVGGLAILGAGAGAFALRRRMV